MKPISMAFHAGHSGCRFLVLRHEPQLTANKQLTGRALRQGTARGCAWNLRIWIPVQPGLGFGFGFVMIFFLPSFADVEKQRQVFSPRRHLVTDVLDLTVAIYWTMDILGTFFTGFYSRKGELIRTHREIALHYLNPGCIDGPGLGHDLHDACMGQCLCLLCFQRKRWFFLDVMIVSVDWVFMSASLGHMLQLQRIRPT